MADIKTYTITIGKVYNNGVECTSPHVELAGKQHIAVNCIDLEGCKYQVQLGPNDTEPCLTFFVTCEDCDVCGTTVIKKCFCESVDDCDECEICDTEGFCDKTCDTCCDGTCCECNEETPCTCNLVCQNGNCKCPAGTTLNANGCCDECALDADCATCEVCVSHGGYKACELNDCNCDITGKCGEEGECVECLSSGHCPVNEVCNNTCECTCAPGYKRVNGICVPHECPNGDDDCEICEICSGEFCVPLQCPAGKVPAEVNGVCNCVQECNCAKPDCNSKFNYCGDSSIPGRCACLPCEGSCDAGCEDPCICDDDLNRCKFNPCFGTCDSGLDCGPTCGCDNGTCVPCDSLDCGTEDDCTRALGCECTAAQKCAKDGGCDEAPCSVASDCNVGCTCDEGICQSCSNYSCETSDCSDRDGCACNAGNCGPDSGECNDVATLEKDDDACELTATLTKDNCCQCPALTLDVQVLSAPDITGGKKVTYRAEVRKGDYDGVSVTSNPRVDEFDNENIAENEPPISGTIKLAYVVNYKTYNTVSGAYLGLSSADPVVVKKTFNPTDVIGFKDFVVEFPKIESETTSGQIESVVSSIDVTFSLDTPMSFENECVYPAGTVIGVFSIANKDAFLQTPIGSTITAPNCRKPFFKWTRFAAGSTVGDTFRKNYVDPISVGFYSETISGPTDAQSCYTYVFEPDCNCDDPVSKHIVFCNPSDFDKPVLTNCGKTYSFVIPATCSANITKYYELVINTDTRLTVKGGKKFLLDTDATVAGTHTEPITSIVLHMICDTTAECDIEFEYDERNINPIPQPECQADGTVNFTFPTLSTTIVSVTFDGVLKTGSPFTFTGKQPNTVYEYVVTYSDGCISDELETSAVGCCNDPVVECIGSGTNVGKYQVISTGGVVKYLNPLISPTPQTIPTSGIITPPVSGTASLVYTCGAISKTIPVLPYSQNNECCNIIPSIEPGAEANSLIVAIDANSTGGPFTVFLGLGVATATVAAGGSHTFTNLPDGALKVTIISTTNSACRYERDVNISDCALGLDLVFDSTVCSLVASTDEKSCDCPTGKATVAVTSIASSPGNKISFAYAITPTINDSTGINVVSPSTIKIYENGGSVAVSTKNINSLSTFSNTATVKKIESTNNSIASYDAKIEVCDGGCGGQTHALTVYSAEPYVLTSVKYGTTTQGVGSGAANEYYSYISPSNISTALILTFSNGTTTFTTQPQSFTGALKTYTFSTSSTTYGNYSNVKFVYDISLADGCIYKGEVTKKIEIGQSDTPSDFALVLTPSTLKRDMEFILYEDGTQKRRDFEEDFEKIYSTTDVNFQPGAEYKVKAICGCEEEEAKTDCFATAITKYEPTGYVWASNCNKKYGITINSCYYGEKMNVSLAGASKTVTLSSAGVANVTFDLPTSYTGANIPITYSYQRNGSGTWCSNSTTIANGSVPAHTVTRTCTDGTNQEYTATIVITGGGTVLITSIPPGAGYGTINGASLEGITTNNSFSVTISINGACSYLIPIYKDCSCNTTGATVAIPTINICAFKEGSGAYTTVDKTLAITGVTQVTGADWFTALGSTAIGGPRSGSSATISITGAQLLLLAPNTTNATSSTTVSLNISDSAGGDVCVPIPITINRTNVQYTTTATCGASSWSVAVSSSTSPITLTNVSAGGGTQSGNNINGIPFTTTSVTFKVNKGTCVSSTHTEEIPSGCAPTCSSSEIDITNVIAIAPCSISGHPGGFLVYIDNANASCPVTSVYSAGQSYIEDFDTYWAITFPSDVASGEKTIIAYTACGASCSAQAIATLTQDCCAQAVDISLNTQPVNFCNTGGAVSVSVYNQYGFTISDWGISTGSWLPGHPTNTGGTVTVPGGQTQLNISANVKDALGNVCFPITATVYSINCDVDLCTGVACPNCQMCQNGTCIANPDLQNQQGPCAANQVCCNGACTAECSAAADVYVSGCTYTDQVCASDCGQPTTITANCYTVSSVSFYTECDYVESQLGTYFTIKGSAVFTRNSSACPTLTTNVDQYEASAKSIPFVSPGWSVTPISVSEIIANDKVLVQFENYVTGGHMCTTNLDITMSFLTPENSSCVFGTVATIPNVSIGNCFPCLP